MSSPNIILQTHPESHFASNVTVPTGTHHPTGVIHATSPQGGAIRVFVNDIPSYNKFLLSAMTNNYTGLYYTPFSSTEDWSLDPTKRDYPLSKDPFSTGATVTPSVGGPNSSPFNASSPPAIVETSLHDQEDDLSDHNNTVGSNHTSLPDGGSQQDPIVAALAQLIAAQTKMSDNVNKQHQAVIKQQLAFLQQQQQHHQQQAACAPPLTSTSTRPTFPTLKSDSAQARKIFLRNLALYKSNPHNRFVPIWTAEVQGKTEDLSNEIAMSLVENTDPTLAAVFDDNTQVWTDNHLDGFKMLTKLVEMLEVPPHERYIGAVIKICQLAQEDKPPQEYCQILRTIKSDLEGATFDQLIVLFAFFGMNKERFPGLTNDYLTGRPEAMSADIYKFEQLMNAEASRQNTMLPASSLQLPSAQRAGGGATLPSGSTTPNQSVPYPPKNFNKSWKKITEWLKQGCTCPGCLTENENVAKRHLDIGCPACANAGIVCKKDAEGAAKIVAAYEETGKKSRRGRKGKTPDKPNDNTSAATAATEGSGEATAEGATAGGRRASPVSTQAKSKSSPASKSKTSSSSKSKSTSSKTPETSASKSDAKPDPKSYAAVTQGIKDDNPNLQYTDMFSDGDSLDSETFDDDREE